MNNAFYDDVRRQARAQERIIEDLKHKVEVHRHQLETLPEQIEKAEEVLAGYQRIMDELDDDPFKED